MKVCPSCKSEEKDNSKFCSKCGHDLTKVSVEKDSIDLICKKCNKVVKGSLGDVCDTCKTKLVKYEVLDSSSGTQFNINDIDLTLRMNNDMYISKLISEELKKNPSSNSSLPDIEKRKTITTLIYGLVTVLFIVLYAFYHVSLTFMFIIFFIMTIVYLRIIKDYNLNSYIIKQVKARPDEKISYITSSIVSSANTNRFIFVGVRLLVLLAFLFIPIFLFREPHLIYEKQESGYALRYYTLGFYKSDSELVIPDKYKNEPVIGIRGDVFKNVKNLKSVTLPDTIEEIRGGAFENCVDLENINIPDKVDEIHGDTFSGCSSLESINIPDKVTRIGGHAFFGCHGLREVKITEKSELKEIGSSAFRECYNLYSIHLPYGVNVNERAFKESPTTIEYYEADISNVTKEYAKSETFTFNLDDRHSVETNAGKKTVRLSYRNTYSNSFTFNVYTDDSMYPRYISLTDVYSYKEVDNILLVIEEVNDDNMVVTVYYN